MLNLCSDWSNDAFPYIFMAPDEKFGVHKRAWQGCPTIAVTKKGRMFAGWYTGGAFEPCIDNYNVLAMSEDGGKTWQDPLLVVGSDYTNRMRHIDIQLWMAPGNVLWVMWTLSPYYETSRRASIRDGWNIDYHKEFPGTTVMVCRDPDAEVLVWEKPRYLCDGFMRSKPIRTAFGRIIAPGYDYAGEMYTLSLSDDGGESFRKVYADGKPAVCVYDEIMPYENAQGRLRFLARTNTGWYVCSDSFDNGETWSKAVNYVKATSSRCYIGRLHNDSILYVSNASETSRTGMKVMLSQDGGESFPFEMLLDDRGNVSYPDVDQDEAGNIYIVYDRERDNRTHLDTENWTSRAAKEILLCKLTVEDIKSGDLSEGSFLRRVIAKGGVDTVDH